MEIIAFEAIATRLTNSCLSSGDRPDIRPRTADIHRCIVADTAGKVHSFLDLLRRGLDLLHKPVVDLPKLLPKTNIVSSIRIEISICLPSRWQFVSRSLLPLQSFR